MIRYTTLLFVFSSLLYSCGQNDKNLTISAYSPGSDSHNAALALKEVLEDEGWKISIVEHQHIESVDAVRNNNIDLAIISNDISIDATNLRTIIPLYHEVLTVLVKNSSPISKLKSLPETREYLNTNKAKFLFGYEGGYAHLLSKRLLDAQEILPSQYESFHFPVSHTDYEKGKLQLINEVNPDAIYFVGSEDNSFVHDVMSMGYVFSDSEDQLENIEASSTMSFANKMARCFPAIVPTYAFSIYQDHPVLTLGIYTSLVAHKDMDDDLAYELAKEIVAAFPTLITANPSFVDIREDFDRRMLNYKLHLGSRHYFDREKPSFFERYAELWGVIFSMSVVFVTFLGTIKRVIKQRRKDRIDVFYQDARKIAKMEDPAKAKIALKQLQDKAFSQLEEERLNADSSFIVFMQLVAEIKEELSVKSSGIS